MSNINQISPDGGTTLYDIEDTDARSDISTLQSTKANVSDLGTSAYKNSTSVVTDSTDLVESGAVYDAIVGTVGWIGGRNKYDFTKNKPGTNNVDVVFTQTGVRVYTLNNSQYASSEVLLTDLNLENGKDYVLIADVTYTKGVGKLAVRRGYGIVYQTSDITQNGKYILPFTMASDLTRISLFITLNNTIEGDITYDNIMILSAEDYTETTPYEPYHASVDETKADNSVIAPVENGSTASQAYAVGSHAIRNGAFITWKNAKAQGETINDVSDYTSGDVAEFLKESDVTITAGTNVTVNANTHVYKKNGIIVGTLRLTIGATLTQQSKIATLPASKNIQYFIAIDNVNASVIPVILNANGNMELFSAFVPENGHDLIIPICYVASN